MDNKLEKLRKQIDNIDQQILTLLAKRIDVVRKIGSYKKEQSIPALDKKRWNEVLRSNIKQGDSFKLSKDFIKKFFTLLHQYSLKVQKEIGKL